MKLTEYKTKTHHYFVDEHGLLQRQYEDWHANGQQRLVCHFRDGEFHGECKAWNPSGELFAHHFDIDGEEVINFLENPELYPSTPEEKTMFVLKYGSAQFIGDSNETD